MNITKPYKVGIAGTGFIGRGMSYFLSNHSGIDLQIGLTRRKIHSIIDFPNSLTNSLIDFINASDIIVECSGSINHAANIVELAHSLGKPVITLNVAFQLERGTEFAKTGILTESEGDQPGTIAVLDEELKMMGFKPIVYGNIKGFYNPKPTLENMMFWSNKQGISLDQVIEATNGTKLQMEMAVVANGLGARILQPGMTGIITNDLNEGAIKLAEMAGDLEGPIVDYLLSDPNSKLKLPKGVFIVALHGGFHQSYFDYYKLGKGPFYLFHKPFYLPHLEVIKTIYRIAEGKKPLINNGVDPKYVIELIDSYNIGNRDISMLIKRGEITKISDVKNNFFKVHSPL